MRNGITTAWCYSTCRWRTHFGLVPTCTFNGQSLPADVWIRAFSYLDFFDLNRIKRVSKFLLQCLETRASQEKLFRAPFSQLLLESNFEEGSIIQMHPFFSSFVFVATYEESAENRRTKGFGGSLESFRETQVLEMFEIGQHNATNPPSKRRAQLIV